MTEKTDRKTPPVLTGTVVPLAALRSEKSCGIGEFPDLLLMGEFCKKTGLKLVQLLPVNDTGTDSSPYNALSAFALHPVYIRIQDIPEAADFGAEIDTLRKTYNPAFRVMYRELRKDKLELLRKIYDKNSAAIASDSALQNWIHDNPWIETYAVFMEYKRRNSEASWKDWPRSRRPSRSDIVKEWNNPAVRTEHLFFAWIQMHQHRQFSAAAQALKKDGIILKGDIPILMNEDSCDAWAYPEFFDDTIRAGSPPDTSNPLGQNWGFPVYNWDNLKKDGYSWWKQRLTHASAYYQAYRIDHVLGFFRIWAVPEQEYTAAAGHTVPFCPITARELSEAGFSGERLRWLSRPHIPTRAIEAVTHNDYKGAHHILRKLADRIENEELWLFKPEIRGEKDIYAADIPVPAKDVLASYWRNRMLIELEPGVFVPMWTWQSSTAWKTLSSEEQQTIYRMFSHTKDEEELLWEKQAREILGELAGCTPMIACAEDLGVNPRSVPSVLADLGILSLRVVRWSREWDREKQPYIPFDEYPFLSVATSSVHDSSTLRLWWTQEKDAGDFLRDFPAGSIREKEYTPETARYLLETMAQAHSVFYIPPIQDLLSLSPAYYAEKPDDERINTPGSICPANWSYRLPVPLEQLAKDSTLVSAVREVVSVHEKTAEMKKKDTRH